MTLERLATAPKIASALRRLPLVSTTRYIETAGLEGFACVFEMGSEAEPIVVELASGRA